MSAFAYEKSIFYWLLVLAWQGLHPLSNSLDVWHWCIVHLPARLGPLNGVGKRQSLAHV